MKKFHPYSIIVKDYEWNSPHDLQVKVKGYLENLELSANIDKRKNYKVSVLSDFKKGDTKIIMLLQEWEEEEEDGNNS